MKYKIQTSYNWYRTDKETFIIKVFYINGIAFTFDELPLISQQDPEIIEQADNGLIYDPEIFYLKSLYLIDEECHPCLFKLDIENPEDMPDEVQYNQNY